MKQRIICVLEAFVSFMNACFYTEILFEANLRAIFSIINVHVANSDFTIFKVKNKDENFVE